MENSSGEDNLILLLNQKFRKIDGYLGWDRTIQYITINEDGKIRLKLYRSNQSSIHYKYKIDMIVYIDKNEISVVINTETSASRGDPYCQRGYNSNPIAFSVIKNKNEFETNEEIVTFIDKLFWKYYFKIESRN